MAALLFFTLATTALFGFDRRQAGGQPASPSTAAPQSESPQAERMRQFLGLGREPDRKAAARGAKLFASNCAFCHGADARGGEGPDLLRSQLVLDDSNGELVAPLIHTGRTSRGMPAFASFTQEQLYEIAEFLHLQVELAANRGTYRVQNIVTGDAKAGEAFFNGQGKCNQCHSPAGDLAHIGSRLQPPELQQAFLYPAAVGAKQATRATVTLADGKTITGTVKHLDDFYILLVDGENKSYSIPLKKGIKVAVEDKLAFHRSMLNKYDDTQMHDLTAYLVTLK
jgi:mono/diheme cytochrome c family protein